MRSVSETPVCLGAGRYLSGQLGFGAAVWVSERSGRGPSISGVELLLENRDISVVESEIHRITGEENEGPLRHWGPYELRVQFEATRGLHGQTLIDSLIQA